MKINLSGEGKPIGRNMGVEGEEKGKEERQKIKRHAKYPYTVQ